MRLSPLNTTGVLLGLVPGPVEDAVHHLALGLLPHDPGDQGEVLVLDRLHHGESLLSRSGDMVLLMMNLRQH